MKKRWLKMTFGLAVGAVVVLAACAPADDDGDAADSSDTPTGPPTAISVESSAPSNQTDTTPGGVATETPSGSTSGGSTGGSTGATPTEVAAEPEMATSVSGKPLDEDAVFGGILTTAYTREGPTFSTWEEAGGVAPYAVHPSHNMLVQPRTWGTMEDYANLVFFELHPDLAESWEVSTDGLQWIFKIRDGVTWTDGTPFTCADAKWSFDTIRTGEGLNRSPRALAFNTVKADIDEGFVCADDLTLIANHDRPKSAFLEVMAMPYHVMRPAHVYDGNTDAMREEAPSVGTGPFVLAEWLPGESYTWEANEDYWDAPFPYLDGIKGTLGTNASNDAAFRAGRLDVHPGVNGGRADTLLRECDQCVFFGRTFDSGFQALMTHHQRTPWNTTEIKDAISLAMDRSRIGQIAADGWMEAPTAGPFYPGGAFDMPDDILAGIPGYDFSDPAANKDAARDLLAQAGYQQDELTVPFTIWNIASIAATAVVIQEELETVGFKVEPILLETARAYQAWSDGDFDVGLHGFWVAGLDPDIVLYEHFYTGSDRNYNRYSKVETDRLIDEMSGTVDPELRKQRAWDVGEILLRDHAKHIIGNGSRIGGHQPNVGGYMFALNYLYGYGPTHRYQHVYLTG
jgi:peptide/nickel transport system substrate-binding protein